MDLLSYIMGRKSGLEAGGGSGDSGGGSATKDSLFVTYDPAKEYEEATIAYVGKCLKLTDDALGRGEYSTALFMADMLGMGILPEGFQYAGAEIYATWNDEAGMLIVDTNSESSPINYALLLSVPQLNDTTEAFNIPSTGTWFCTKMLGGDDAPKTSFLIGK